MIATTLKVTIVGLAFLGLSCVATLMYSFMGGFAGSPDAKALIALQRFGIVFGATALIACLFFAARQSGLQKGLATLWRHLPGWLVFAGGLLIFLALIGEVAWIVMRESAANAGGSFNHVSLVCLGSSSLAVMALYATVHRVRGHPEYSKSRW